MIYNYFEYCKQNRILFKNIKNLFSDFKNINLPKINKTKRILKMIKNKQKSIDCDKILSRKKCLNDKNITWGYSSIGRAFDSRSKGWEFKSLREHHF